MFSWDVACIDAYKPIPYHKGWKKCPKCGEIPRLWIFDNGAFARCRCLMKYDPDPVRAESIMSYAKRHNGSIYGRVPTQEMLRMKWNAWVSHGVKQDKLREGWW